MVDENSISQINQIYNYLCKYNRKLTIKIKKLNLKCRKLVQFNRRRSNMAYNIKQNKKVK